MNYAALPLLTALLAGCTALDFPQFAGTQRERVSATTPGIAITQAQPSRLESISFLSNTTFTPARARRCATGLFPPANEAGEVIHYLGEDRLNASGELAATGTQWGIIPSHYRIRFQLSALAHHNGTTYGFNQISLARQDAWGLNNHGFESLSPSGSRTQQVYDELQALYRRLDECMAG
ncbi:hypothetical protein [Zobellella sp. DQSA1]|uniref:hypothetical protein n=1 Tax=Zobellella sp. DQSA1 TaxID=3342386 RepID=UPI0035C00E46